MEKSEKDQYKVDEQNKIYIIGGRGVGKTSFLYQIQTGNFNEDIKPSEIGIAVSPYKFGNKNFTIKELTDDNNFAKTNLLKNELEDIILIFVLFALDSKESFEYAKNLIQFIKNNLINNEEMYIILLGNKKDLIESKVSEKKIEKREIDQYIYNLDNIRYYEISCKTGNNINIIKDIINRIEIVEDKEEDDGKIPEEERKKKVNEIKDKTCVIY